MPQKLLVISHAYSPSLGGIERVSDLLVEGFRSRGYDVRVVTATPGAEADGVIRNPGKAALLSELRWADLIIQSNVSVRLAWPLVLRLVRRPWIVVNHTPISDPRSQRRRLVDRLKLLSLPSGRTYSVSEYLRRTDAPSSRFIPNPFDESLFHTGDGARTGELIFVGRVVRAKGLDVLLDALAHLGTSGVRPTLTVVGDGSESEPLRKKATLLGLSSQISFVGSVAPAAVAEQMRRHRVLVVPSRPEPPEAFGLVALEGAASGCVVIGTDQGGLPEAIGPGGLVVPAEDPRSLADAIREALAKTVIDEERSEERAALIARHALPEVLDAYESALRDAAHHRTRRRLS